MMGPKYVLEMPDVAFRKDMTPIAPSTLSQGGMRFPVSSPECKETTGTSSTTIVVLVHLHKVAANNAATATLAYTQKSRHGPCHYGVADTPLHRPDRLCEPSRQPQCRRRPRRHCCGDSATKTPRNQKLNIISNRSDANDRNADQS
jgi:hypothetical protein